MYSPVPSIQFLRYYNLAFKFDVNEMTKKEKKGNKDRCAFIKIK